jgi:hypothetical protein
MRFDQSRHRNQRIDVCQRIMRVFVFDAIAFCEQFKAIRRATLLSQRPRDSIGSQRASHAHDIEKIPARPAVFPRPFVWIIKIPPQYMANKFVIKTDVVEPNRNRVWREHFVLQQLCELRFCVAFVDCFFAD